jgi:hypothetical protein
LSSGSDAMKQPPLALALLHLLITYTKLVLSSHSSHQQWH